MGTARPACSFPDELKLPPAADRAWENFFCCGVFQRQQETSLKYSSSVGTLAVKTARGAADLSRVVGNHGGSQCTAPYSGAT